MKGVFPAIGARLDLGLILVYLGGALGVNTWLMKGFFDTIPNELDESAKVDGATHVQIFFKIILPLAAPVLAVIGLLSFIITQAEFLLADTLLGAERELEDARRRPVAVRAWPASTAGGGRSPPAR